MMLETKPKVSTPYDKDAEPEALLNSLLEAGDLDGARDELERLLLEALDSGEPVEMTRESWEELRRELHREAGIP